MTSTSSHRARIAALTVASSAIVLTDSGLPVLGPELRSSFGLSFAQLGWIGGAYALTVALFVLPASALIGRLGPRVALQIGLTLFAAGTVVLALAHSPGTLVTARVLEGVGTACVSPTMFVALRMSCGKSSGRAVAWWSGVSSSMVAVAPFVASVIVAISSWRGYFVVTVAVLLIALVLVTRTMPGGRQQMSQIPRRGIAYGSACFAIIDVALVLRRPDVVALLVIAGAASLYVHRRRASEPGRSILGIRGFVAPTLAGLVVNGILYSIVFFIPLYDRMVLGLPSIESALSLIAISVPPIALGPMIARWCTSRGPRVPMAVGALVLASAMILAGRWTSHVRLQDTLPTLVLAGLGLAALMAPSTTAAMRALPESRVVEGSAVLACARTFGVGLGAWATSVLATDTGACAAISHICLDALSAALTRPLLLDAGIAALLAVVLLVTLRRPSRVAI